ncbi:MAG: TonB-dependent receptor [Cytophagaceae bacterium]|nr:TonB-dependent receptor [Cytophagaceae bacterium]
MLYSSLLFAQNKKEVISGTVKTIDGQPAEFINIGLKNTTYGTYTDEKGNFNFEAPAGEYTMVVSSIAAHRKEYPVIVKPNEINHFPDITIIESAQALDEVVVTGQFFPQSLNRSVYKVKAINAEQIRQKAPSSVEALLNTEIGIRISNDMALGETQFEVMGMSGNNVKVLIDGIPVVERSSNQQILSQIDVNTIERVEIVEGPMSVTYGTDALAGVINIITKKGKSKSEEKLSVTARLQEETIGREYEFASGEGLHTQGITAGYSFDNGLYAAANFSHNEYGGWQGEMPQRAREWPSKNQYLAGGQIGWKKSAYDLQYKLDYLDEEIVKKGDVSAINRAVDEKFLARRFTHQLHGNWEVNNRLKLTLAGSYQDYERDKRNTTIDFVTGEKYPTQGNDANDDTEYSVWFGRATVLWSMRSNLNFQGGLEYQRDKGEGDKVSAEVSAINNAALFLSAEYTPLEWLSIRPGVRSSYNSEYEAPLAIPSLNLKFALNRKMDLRMSYAKGFRSPKLQELYYEFYHTNGGGFWIKGNKELKAETSDSYMASYVWRIIHHEKIRLTSTLSGFYNDYKNQIRLVTSGEVSNDQMYHNIDKYKTVGLTWENTLVWDNFTAEVAFSHIGRYNKLYDVEEYASEKQDKMRYSPELSASLSYKWDKIATFNLFYKYTGKRSEYTEYTANNSTSLVFGKRASYHWTDLTVSRPIGNMLQVAAGVRNLFNVTRIDNTISSGLMSSASNETLIACGRSYFVGLTFNLNR